MGRTRRRRRGILAILAALLLVGGFVAGAAPATAVAATPVLGPDGGAFYTPPSPLPAGKPGDVIWYRPVTTSALLGVVSASLSSAYKVLYLSEDTHGNPIAVSGIILVPLFGNPATVPIVGFAPGTQGLGDGCAPSKTIQSGTEYDQVYINGLINRGFAVAVTDYEGLGTPGNHTYIIGRSEGHAVNDVVRAAIRLPATKLSATAKVAFTGYSQGGGGAAWAAELQPTYAPELNLVGVAAGGIPADLLAVSQQLDGGLGFGFLIASAVGLDTAYPELDLASYLNPTGAAAISGLETECVVDMLLKYAGHQLSEYVTSNPLDNPLWIARINEQKLGLSPPKVPMFQWHSSSDEIVGFPQADALHKTYCAAGVKLSWNVYVGEHVTGLPLGTPTAEQWIADRFAGKTATSNC
jgi:pimeloyl-ACP methyl ester carboxylesterase